MKSLRRISLRRGAGPHQIWLAINKIKSRNRNQRNGVQRSILHCGNFMPLMSVEGHFRQIDPLPTLSACPLRSVRVRTFAQQQFDAVCHKRL